MLIISGGTGLIGKALISTLMGQKKEEKILVITREKERARKILRDERQSNFEFLGWHEILDEKWVERIKSERSRIVINLAGENIGRLWRWGGKKLIMESRIETTRKIVSFAERVRANALINASAVGYYGETGNDWKDENSEGGDTFLSKVCRAWEEEASRAKNMNIFIIRFGVVLAKDAKIIKSSITPFFVINVYGKGENFIPWVHIDDAIRVIQSIIENEIKERNRITVINCVSPEPTKAGYMVRKIAEIKKKPILSIPTPLIEIIAGKDFVRETIKLSQRIKPSFLVRNGFSFKYEKIDDALASILQNRKI